jgi:hypothetical protein
MADNQYVSRKAARASGLKRYTAGKPCKHGHTAPRLVSNGSCLECARLAANARRADDPVAARQRDKEFREANREKRQAAFREWRTANRDKALAANERWKLANPDHIRDYARAYQAKRYAEDFQFRLRVTIRNHVARALKRGRPEVYIRDIGCTRAELRAHIEAQFTGRMSWDNWGSVWEIDHIQPLISFDLTYPAQYLRACHYTNVQPLLVDDHREKSVKEN